jgi:hypothetical protein
MAISPNKMNTITPDMFRALNEPFGIHINEDFLYEKRGTRIGQLPEDVRKEATEKTVRQLQETAGSVMEQLLGTAGSVLSQLRELKKGDAAAEDAEEEELISEEIFIEEGDEEGSFCEAPVSEEAAAEEPAAEEAAEETTETNIEIEG